MSGDPSYGSWLPPAGDPLGSPLRPVEDDGGASRWAPWTAAGAFLAGIAFTLVGVILVTVAGAIFGAKPDDPTPAVTIVQTVVQDAAFVGAAVLFAGRTGQVLPAQFGFVRTRIRPAIGWMLLAYVVYLALGQAWAQLVDTDKVDKLPDSLGVDRSTAALVAVCVLVTVVAPLAEETFFRGYFYGALRNWRGPWLAALLTGLVFGGVHAGGTNAVFLVPLAVLGVVLCVVRERTGSLLPCIALHAINNALAFGITEDWRGGWILLLAGGAVAVTMLACAAVMRPHRSVPDARRLVG